MSLSLPTYQELNDLREKARFVSMDFVLPLSVAQAWPHLSNTDLMNTALEMAVPEYAFQQQAGGRPMMIVNTKMAGLDQTYVELPYQWEYGQHLRVERIFEKGLFHYLSYGLKLAPESENQCRVTIFFYYISKVPDLISKPVLNSNLAKIKAIFSKISTQVPLAKTSIPAAGYMQSKETYTQQIEQLKKRWQPLMPDSEIPECLASYLYCAPERYVQHLRSNEVALYYGLDPQEVLRFCLLASKEGWLIPRWAMLCTSCWGAKHQVSEMKQVVNKYHCESCGQGYSMDLNNNLELVFAPVKALRHTQEQSFCAGSPANTPHVQTQILIWPEQTQTIKLAYSPGAYRLWIDSRPIELTLLDQSQCETFSIDLEIPPDQLTLSVGSELQCTHSGSSMQLVRLEDLSFHQHIVTAAQLYALQEFNELFADQIPAAGLQFQAGQQTFLSINMAFPSEVNAWIQDELQELISWTCRDQRGALVQTGSTQYLNYLFADLSHAFASSEKILEHFYEMQALYSDTQMGLSLMLYQSPCEIFSSQDQVCFNIADFQPDHSLMAHDHGLLLLEPEVFANEAMQTWIEELKHIQAEILEDDPHSTWVRIRLIHLQSLLRQSKRPEKSFFLS